ncbi:MAG TPA: hypothetical protein VH089_28110, partial [Streptosporangiaceae bacterium]|nr:hypothetical protein [Streptosporangiaceae bacterium]
PAQPPDKPSPADTPAPDTPTDPWGVANLTRAQAFESLRAKAAAPDSSPPLADQPRDYWNELPRLSEAAGRLADRWPETPKSESAESHEYDVTPEKRAEALQEVTKIADGEPLVSSTLGAATTENPHGGLLVGFEHRCKGSGRLMEKALAAMEAQPDTSAADIVGRIPDAIRYTVCFESSKYVDGYRDIKDRLESSGFEMYYSKNSWANPEYKGINTRWVTSDGQRFEVQFHTPESFHAKHEVTHQAYERLRGTQAVRGERAELHEFQREVSSWIPVPERVTEISDYKKEGF